MINALKKIVYLTRKKSFGKISSEEDAQLCHMLNNYNITFDELKDIGEENKKEAVCHTAILILLKDKKYFILGIIIILCFILVSKNHEKIK